MAIGSSGRVVIDFDAKQKQVLHKRLQQRGLSLRGWFLDRARRDGLLDPELAPTAQAQKEGKQ